MKMRTYETQVTVYKKKLNSTLMRSRQVMASNKLAALDSLNLYINKIINKTKGYAISSNQFGERTTRLYLKDKVIEFVIL